MQRGWLRVVVRYPLVVLVQQGRLSHQEASREMGLLTSIVFAVAPQGTRIRLKSPRTRQ